MTALSVAADPEAAAQLAARRIAAAAAEALAGAGRFHLALAGGETPRRAYELLAPLLAGWSAVELWFGDERAVPPDDPESNFAMVAAALLERAGGATVHRIEGELGAEAAAARYAAALDAGLPRPEGEPRLDLALLGLGPDAHTASLFPRHPALGAASLCVAVHAAPKPPPDRVTLTVPLLRASRRILFLATGEGKAAAVAALLGAPTPHAPASLLGGERTELVCDRAAAPD